MSIYCNEANETFDNVHDAGCFDCGNQCSRFLDLAKSNKVVDEKIMKMRDSELAKEVRAKLSSLLNIDSEKLDIIVDGLTNSTLQTVKNTIKTYLGQAVENATVKHLDSKIKELTDSCFAKVIEEKIIFIQSNEKVFMDTIMKRITEKLSETFKDSRGGRYSENLDEAVRRCVDEKVKTALDELIKETQEKFSKEAMKKMMQGMAVALGQDKKLLTLLTS